MHALFLNISSIAVILGVLLVARRQARPANLASGIILLAAAFASFWPENWWLLIGGCLGAAAVRLAFSRASHA